MARPQALATPPTAAPTATTVTYRATAELAREPNAPEGAFVLTFHPNVAGQPATVTYDLFLRPTPRDPASAALALANLVELLRTRDPGFTRAVLAGHGAGTARVLDMLLGAGKTEAYETLHRWGRVAGTEVAYDDEVRRLLRRLDEIVNGRVGLRIHARPTRA